MVTTENGQVSSTKQDERNALAKIRKIVEGLGENSYVATAFDGAFSLAEQNIDYDAAFSAKYYVEEYNKATSKLRDIETAHERELSKERTESTSWREEYEATAEKLDAMRFERDDQMRDRISAQNELAKAQTENMKLKARLYDLLTAGEEAKI